MYQGKIKLLILIILAIISAIIALTFIKLHYQTTIVDIPMFNHNHLLTNSTNPDNLNSDLSIFNFKSLNLPVPFTPQAPTANWDRLHDEACEEATALMANAYFTGIKDTNLDANYVENQIDKLTSWQQDHFGYYLDTTSAETAQMMENVYGLKTRLINNFTENDIKKELSQNHLVIISEYGRGLGNPYYKQPGPIHHMLLIRGYDGDNFITNDPGTKRGLEYIYDFKTIYDAAGDWNHADSNVDQTKKIAMVVWK